MIQGKTSAGFDFALDEKVLDNMELLDAIAESEKDPVAISRVCLLLLGKDTRARLYEHLRQEDGRVPVEAVSEAVIEIFAACGDKGKTHCPRRHDRIQRRRADLRYGRDLRGPGLPCAAASAGGNAGGRAEGYIQKQDETVGGCSGPRHAFTRCCHRLAGHSGVDAVGGWP